MSIFVRSSISSPSSQNTPARIPLHSLKTHPFSLSATNKPSPSPPSAAVTSPSPATRLSIDSWSPKKSPQLPEYPDSTELEAVLRTIESFTPIVSAVEASNLEERLTVRKAFLLQAGVDCAESFKEFNASNIRDTFRILLQMGVPLTFGGQMPVINVG